MPVCRACGYLSRFQYRIGQSTGAASPGVERQSIPTTVRAGTCCCAYRPSSPPRSEQSGDYVERTLSTWCLSYGCLLIGLASRDIIAAGASL